MKKVYSAKHPTDAHMLKDLLEAKGIEATVRGDDLFGARVPVTDETLPSVWVIEDEDFESARELAVEFDRRPPPAEEALSTWQCVHCGESVEDQFAECWSCGKPRESE